MIFNLSCLNFVFIDIAILSSKNYRPTHRMLNILIKWMIWAKKNWSEVWATTKNCFCVADILIMRVFLWHRFMIISGYSKYETKDVRFQREWVFYSRIKPKRKNEGYLVWYELCTACIHEDTSWMRFGKTFSVSINNNNQFWILSA